MRFGLNTPRRLIAAGRSIFPLIDCVQLAWLSKEEMILGREIAGALARSHVSFGLTGLRRRLVNLMHAVDGGRELGEALHLEKLKDPDAHRLVETVARRDGDMTRLSLNRIDQLQVLALDIRKRLRIVLGRRRVPIPLVEVLLQPRRTIETFTVNRLNL